MATQVQSGLATGTEGLVCFVCDAGVVGRYYTLATCRTQTSKVRLIEKLGQLVGDDYMVVISEEDVICRGCATMINSLDRLEKEVGSLRSIVLRYLEKKYEMDDGELVNARSNIPVGTTGKSKDGRAGSPIDFQVKKRKAASAGEEEEAPPGKDQTWLQCDRCKYTTHLNSFMVHHVRASHKEKPGTSEVPAQQASVDIRVEEKHNGEAEKGGGGGQVVRLQVAPSEEGVTVGAPVGGEMDQVKKDVGALSEEGSETVEMIAAEIGQDFTDEGSGEMLQMSVTTADAGTKQVTLQAVENEDGGNTLCMVDENGMIVQKVQQAEDGTLYVQMGNDDPTKQVLSVGEDGSVQMVEVLWDDMVNADEGEGATMVTF